MIEGLWYEVRPARNTGSGIGAGVETHTRPLRLYDQNSPMVEMEVLVRRYSISVRFA